MIPELPRHDDALGEIRWGPWEEAPALSHLPGHCLACDHPGPLRTAAGRTWQPPEETWVRVQRGSRAAGRASRWEWRAVGRPGWRQSHFVVRCPRCGDTTVRHPGRRTGNPRR